MSQSIPFKHDVRVRIRLAAVIASSLSILTIPLTGTVLAEEAAVLSSRRVLVMYDLNENLSAGTRITRLLDHNLTLRNFWLAEPQDDAVFTVDSHDGSVRINRDDQMDFESQQKIRCLVMADEDLAEQDQFLEEFSAGLLEDGLTAGALKSLSTGTVTFDITVRLRDVPEPPELSDANLLVQVLNDSSTEFGTVSTGNRQSFEELHYFIVSGNEDDVFKINADTGTLSLRGSEALHFDMLSTHELVILAENAAGLSATANVVVSVFNETPQLSPLSKTATAQVSEQNSSEDPSDAKSLSATASTLPFALPFGLSVKLRYEAESRVPLIVVESDDRASTPPESITEHTTVTNIDTDSAIKQPAESILNTDTIDTAEVRKWVAATEHAGQTGSTSAATSAVTKMEPSLPAAEAKYVSKGILTSVVALILFVLSCVTAAVAFSRAASARRGVRGKTASMNAESAAKEALRPFDMESEQETESIQAAMQSPVSDAAAEQNGLIEKSATLQDAIAGCNSETQVIDTEATKRLPAAMNSAQTSEEICQLQDQLASRDQLITQLRKELLAMGRGLGKSAMSDRDTDSGINDESWASHGTYNSNDPQLTHSATLRPQMSQCGESETDVRSSLTTARERLKREFVRDTQKLPVSHNNDESETDFSCESTASATAILGEPDDLRQELADLFASQSVIRSGSAAPLSEVAVDSATTNADEVIQEDEDSHHVSVKRYLSQLLERTKESTSPDAIVADRPKPDDLHRGADRRSSSPEPTRKPVKSFLESYMSTHGGDLAEPSENRAAAMPAEESEVPSRPAKPRTPVDVQSIRESMNSFRAVAIQSVENAVLSHDLRLAKGKVAVRTMMIAGLIAVTIVVFLANMVQAVQFSMLNWFMVAIVALALVELGLRIHSIRKQRKGLTSATLTPRPEKHVIGALDDDDDTLLE